MRTKKQTMIYPLLKRLHSLWSARSPFLLFAAKIALAGGFSWAIVSALLGAEAAALAVVSAVIVVQVTSWQTVRKSIERILGVIIGVSLAVFVTHFLGLTFWTITLIIFLAQIVGLVLQNRGQYLATQIPISATLVLVVGATASNYPLLRLLGALVGGLIGTIMSLLLSPPIYVFRTQDAIVESMTWLAGAIPNLADALAGHLSEAEICEIYPSMQKLEQRVRTAEQAYLLGMDSTRLNPWAHRARRLLVDYPDMLLALDRLVRQMRRIAYTLNEPELAWSELVQKQAWALDYAWLLKEIGTNLAALAKDVSSPVPRPSSELIARETLRSRLEDAQQRLRSWQMQLAQDAKPIESQTESTASLAINAGSLLALRGAILTDLRHMLDEVRDIIEAARQGE